MNLTFGWCLVFSTTTSCHYSNALRMSMNLKRGHILDFSSHSFLTRFFFSLVSLLAFIDFGHSIYQNDWMDVGHWYFTAIKSPFHQTKKSIASVKIKTVIKWYLHFIFTKHAQNLMGLKDKLRNSKWNWIMSFYIAIKNGPMGLMIVTKI